MTATNRKVTGKVQWGTSTKPAPFMVNVILTEGPNGWTCDEFHGQPWIWSDESRGETIAEANKPQSSPILAIRRFLRTWDKYGSTYVNPGSISTSATNLVLDDATN